MQNISAKRVLIISPYFPPINAADMQRVRMSLPYFREQGWEAEVVSVDPKYIDIGADNLLTESVPPDVPVHLVKALPKKWTSKLGLGSIAIRSMLFYRWKVNKLLKQKKFDLVYFSTTQFPVCILGPYWKKRFAVPYVIDMQDPWHTDYYNDKPKQERPPKYWASYRLNKWMEPIAMRKVAGLISVSEGYLKTLAARYPNCKNVPKSTIPFGAFPLDFEIAYGNINSQPSVLPKSGHKINIVYIGRGGNDMSEAIRVLFKGFQIGLGNDYSQFSRIHFYFFGTSYAGHGKGTPTIAPVAAKMGLSAYVSEVTDRIPFYQTLNTLADADALFIPGSNDTQYTASKVYPYILTKKPLLAIFHPESSVVSFLKKAGVGSTFTFDQPVDTITAGVHRFIKQLLNKETFKTEPDLTVVSQSMASVMTEHQCKLFEAALIPQL